MTAQVPKPSYVSLSLHYSTCQPILVVNCGDESVPGLLLKCDLPSRARAGLLCHCSGMANGSTQHQQHPRPTEHAHHDFYLLPTVDRVN